MQLSPKQLRFCDEYLVDLNATQAAIRSGFSRRSARQIATRLLSKDVIQSLIEKRCKETEERLQIRRDDVIRGLLSAFQDAKALGRPTDMISAMREVGKLLEYYNQPPQQSVIPEGGQAFLRRLETMSEAELLAIIAEGDEGLILVGGSDAA